MQSVSIFTKQWAYVCGFTARFAELIIYRKVQVPKAVKAKDRPGSIKQDLYCCRSRAAAERYRTLIFTVPL